MSETPITLAHVQDAADRLEGAAHRTPVLRSSLLDALAGSEVHLKAENFQRVGAFKFRGAYNALAQLPAEQLARGVAAYSSGNHGQAVALAARELGSSALLVMPQDAPPTKLAATAAYGAEIVTYDRWTESREEIGAKLAAERGLTVIPPYDYAPTMAGQGTVALELLEQTEELEALLVPVGGGGLAAGCATVAAALAPRLSVVGVEPDAGDDTARSLREGARVSIPVPRTIADGQGATTPGELTFAVNRRLLTGVETVGEDEIRAAMRFAFEVLKIVLEPSGATALAALLAGRVRLPRRTGVVLSGGNIGLDRFAEVMADAPALPLP
ncbi:pyridoxal-phosphate dependent enzyme [Streptomyces xiaopingdaonensis]|uniref:pyridoxal-phosphate dependent enzyme n=1 Tax=Streptomyces xiaopingdaonensis TaxID=1565415 RepID=UPI0002E306C8|nr:pyridoxal-phosphate dependent enzyme [Streptomyces xiaopingdaonensis]